MQIKSTNRGFFLLTWIAIVIFFGVLDRYHLLYIEGMQMFLFTKEYLVETCMRPGGLADYLSRFLIQFYHFPLIGGVIVATLLMTLQLGVSAISNSISGKNRFLPLTYIPSIIYTVLMCNENYSLTGLFGLVASVWAAWGYTRINGKVSRTVYGFLSVPVVWYTMGGGVIAMLLLIIFYEIVAGKRQNISALLSTIASAALLFFIAPFMAPQLSGINLLLGGHYFRFAVAPIKIFFIIWTSVVAVIILIHFHCLPAIKKVWLHISIMVIILLSGGYAVFKFYMPMNEEVMCYLDMTHNREWKNIIEKAEAHKPRSIVATNCLNLALGETGQIGDRMFDFFQYGLGSLMLDYKEDILFSGEILFNLGFINEAQHYAYSSMESIPDKQRGTIFVTRLAETNLIAGRDEVAKKYLRILKKTLFYGKWADDRLAIVGDSAAISNHSVYGNLLRMQPDSNFIFNSDSFDKMLEIMFDQHPDNTLAYNYLLASYLLTKNLPAFYKRVVVSDNMPRHYNEALLLICYLNHESPDNLPKCIKESMIENFEKFISQCNESKGNPEPLRKEFGNTFWYYITFTKM